MSFSIPRRSRGGRRRFHPRSGRRFGRSFRDRDITMSGAGAAYWLVAQFAPQESVAAICVASSGSPCGKSALRERRGAVVAIPFLEPLCNIVGRANGAPSPLCICMRPRRVQPSIANVVLPSCGHSKPNIELSCRRYVRERFCEAAVKQQAIFSIEIEIAVAVGLNVLISAEILAALIWRVTCVFPPLRWSYICECDGARAPVSQR